MPRHYARAADLAGRPAVRAVEHGGRRAGAGERDPGVGYLLFAIPIFLFTPDRPSSGLGMRQAVVRGLGNLIATFRNLAHRGNVARFLLARMIYNDGLNTPFIFGGIYAAGRFEEGPVMAAPR